MPSKRRWPASWPEGRGFCRGAPRSRSAARSAGVGAARPAPPAHRRGQPARAFPDWDEARRRAVALGVYGHFGRVLLDILWMARRDRDVILRQVDVYGAEHVEAARAAGRGALLVTAHIGNWELRGVAHGWLFGPIGVVARPLDNPALDARLCAFRHRSGNSVIYKKRALPQVLRLLRENREVAFLIDQNVQEKDGIFVDFFGRPAATTTVAAALAVKTGCALDPGPHRAARRRPLPAGLRAAAGLPTSGIAPPTSQLLRSG